MPSPFAFLRRPRRRGAGLLIPIIFGLVGVVPLVVAVVAAATILQGASDVGSWGTRYGLAATIALFGLANPVFTAFPHATSRAAGEPLRRSGGSGRGTRTRVIPRSPWPGVIYLVATGVAWLVSGPLTTDGVASEMAHLPVLGGAVLSVLGVVGYVYGLLSRAWRER